MSVPVLYPKVSLEEVSGRISRWCVHEGEEVRPGQILFEIENDKAAVEVEAPAAGWLAAPLPAGREVEVGATVALILSAAERGAAPGGAEAAPSSAPVAAAVIPPARAASAVVGPGSQASATARGPNPTPLARRIAREHGLSLAGLSGSGPRGRVQRRDVLALLAAAGEEAAPPSAPEVRDPAPRASSGAPLHSRWLRAEGEGLPMVLLHGFSADLNSWRGFLSAARPGPAVLALDLPCHGQSPRELPGSLEEIAARVEAALEAASVGPCLLVGHSFGGAVAARVAARGQADLRGLALIAPAGLDPAINGDFLRGVLRAKTAESLTPWLELLVQDPALITPAFVRATVAAREDTGLTAAMQAFAARFFPDDTQSFSIRDDLAALRLPVRVIFGREDRILPFRSAAALPGRVALHAFSACGHLPHLEYPDAVDDILSGMRRALS